YSFLQNVLVDGGSQFGVSALAFDSQEELLWMGNSGGHVTSYYTSELQKYTSFQVHATNEVRQLSTVDAGVLSLTSNTVRLNNRRGLIVFHHSSEEMEDMHCMTLSPSGSLLMGGNQPSLIELDLSRGDHKVVTDVGENGCAVIRRHPRFICCADFNGKVTLRDPNTFNVEYTLESLSGTGVLSDFDVLGNMVVTCGFTNRHGALTVDMFIKVYDLRVMRAVAPIQMMFPPSLLRFVPAFTSRLFVVSQTGQFQLVDTSITTQSSYIYQLETGGAGVHAFDTSSSCQALAFGDVAGYLHLYGASSHVNFNNFSNPTEFADPEEPHHPIDINDPIAPLSTIPMPYCSGKLLSDLPKEFTKYVYRRSLPIDQVILNTMKMVGSVGYAPNPGLWKRNEVRYPQETHHRRSKETREDMDMIPQWYKKIDVKYSKMGIEDFDFNLYNRTCFAGLETNLPNAYCNNMIQVLYFTDPLRCAVINHICQREFCLACELGFLFHMLDTAQGIPCQASNFLRAFRTIPEASALGLILSDSDEARKKVNFPRLVQSWTRFVLQQIHSVIETRLVPLHWGGVGTPKQRLKSSELGSELSKLYGWTLLNSNQCRCGNVREKESTTLLCSLVYPDPLPPACQTQAGAFRMLGSAREMGDSPNQIFASCGCAFSVLQSKRLRSLPDILTISSGLENQQDLNFWQTQIELGPRAKALSLRQLLHPGGLQVLPRQGQGKKVSRKYVLFKTDTDSSPRTACSWLPLSVHVKLNEDGTVAISRSDCKRREKKLMGGAPEMDSGDSGVLYELTAVVSVVNNTRTNIVSCVRVGPSYHLHHQGGAASQWYLFNDFTIVPISPEEAVWLPLDWKLPCVLYYSCVDLASKHRTTVKTPLTVDVFLQDMSLASDGGRRHVTFQPLTANEILRRGDIVAMDAEFVTLNQEEAEIRSDGTRSTIRPSHMSVARISCLRGQGSLEGVPFIDDYIATQEQVVDYLTQFSGIQPGDLDVTISSKHLTTLKATYQKLRYLMDEGVIFVGHGLKNDFRVINLVVPPEQVIDTVLLFQLPNKRMVSLRFLAWHFLGLKIQSKMHDSIEDAKTALRLYRKYQQLEKDGKVIEALKEMYEAGRNLSWKVPGTEEE
ncbi:ubiquitin specific protease, putative, partial [Ixodes scapularis]